MNDLKLLVSRLSAIEFVNSNDEQSINSVDGWAVSYSLVVTNELFIQVLIRVSHKGNHVATFGCVTVAQNTEFLRWFKTEVNHVNSKQVAKKRAEVKESKNLYNQLFLK